MDDPSKQLCISPTLGIGRIRVVTPHWRLFTNPEIADLWMERQQLRELVFQLGHALMMDARAGEAQLVFNA